MICKHECVCVSISEKFIVKHLSMVLSNQFANNSINKKAFICKGKYLKSKKNQQQSHFKYHKYIRQAGAICLSVNLPIFCCITINHEYYLVSSTPPVCYLINYLHLTPFLPPTHLYRANEYRSTRSNCQR